MFDTAHCFVKHLLLGCAGHFLSISLLGIARYCFCFAVFGLALNLFALLGPSFLCLALLC